MIKGKRIKVFCVVFLGVAFVGLLVFARGPYVSNQLKKLIFPELSEATGRQVMAQKIYLNLFPLFVEARELKISDRGEEVIRIPRIKAYLGVSRLMKKELILKRLVIEGPAVRTDDVQVKDIIGKIRQYQERERKAPVTVLVRTIALDNGAFDFAYGDMSFSGSGLNAEALFGPPRDQVDGRTSIPRVSFGVKTLTSSIKGWPDLKGEIRGLLSVKDDVIDLKGLQAGFFGSMINVGGAFSKGRGEFQVRLGLLVDSFKRIFGLKQRGEGEVSAKGTIRLTADDLSASSVDMELKGDMYIQTLMELLEVKEKVEGFVAFTGNLKGPLKDLTGTARVRLSKGNLFDVEIDEITSAVAYKEGRLFFSEARASLYHGRAEAGAVLALAGPAYYSLHVKYADVDSSGAFKLIKWDPGIPQGKVRGELSTEGAAFNPAGTFEYLSTAEGKDVLGRVKKAKGSFRLNGDLLTLVDTEVSTPRTTLILNGDADLAASALSMRMEMKTSDLTDLTMPYLHKLAGAGSISATVKGNFDNPSIGGNIKGQAVSYGGYYFGSAEGRFDYRKDLLEVREVTTADSRHGEQAKAALKGTVRFPAAKELFDFASARYDLRVSMKNGDIERAVRFIYEKTLEAYPQGRFEADFGITGASPAPEYKGSFRMDNPKLAYVSADSGSASFSYDYRDLVVKDALLKRGDSVLSGEGTLFGDDRFVFSVSGKKLLVKDLLRKAPPFDAYLNFSAEGRGTLDNPEIDVSGTFHGGRVRNVDVGDGKVKAVLRGRKATLEALLFADKVALSGKADLSGDMPWTARLEVKPGRYDFLLGAFLKETPEDLLINMKGHADMSGDRNRFSAKAVVNQMNVTLYGYSFSNDSEVDFEVTDRKVIMPQIRMRSGTTAFKVQGSMEIGKGYDLVMEGSSALSPIKGFSKRIDTIRGDASFVLSVTGKWDNPKVNGGLTITNGVFAMKDVPFRIASINGYLYIDEDRIVIQKLSGRSGGGDLDISGVAYLQAWKIRRFYIDAVLKDMAMDASKSFPVSFDGNLLYQGTLDSQTLSGDVRIKRARYRERVEWKSWLLKAKAKEKPRGEIGPLEKAVLNVKISGADNITVDNNVARAQLKIDLILRGTISHPVIFGRVESKTGTVYFRNNEFRIINASADFSDPRRINPVMEIVAETAIKGYNIRMNLEGQLDHFNLSLLSDPPLEEIDILSLLTVGRFGKELKGFEGGIGAGEATAFLTGKFQDVVEERLRSITGLDRVEVDPYVSKTTGTVNPRVTVSKRLLGERLFVTYTSAVGSTENDVLKLEYLLGRNTSLIGVRDEKGALGGDVKFRFEFK